MNRAAIVIGVNKAGMLPALADARDSANKFADWLEASEGFIVQRFIDMSDTPVEIKSICKAVAKYVRAGNLDQLVIYFSGHGFLVGDAEMWMLSEAPEYPAEAVNLTASVVRAREAGIPHVVFISDACRSIPETFQAALVEGSSIFPNPTAPAHNEVVIDRFYAAKPTEAALELKLKEAAQGYSAIYTKVLLQVFEKTPSELVLSRMIDGAQADVVPNRRLKAYMRKRVPIALADLGVPARQRPDAYIECDDNAFVGRAKGKAKAPEPVVGFRKPAPNAWIKATSGRTASTAFSSILFKIDPENLKGATEGAADELAKQFSATKVKEIKELAAKSMLSISAEAASAIKSSESVKNFFKQTKKILGDKKGGVEKFETRTGFEVRGGRIRDAVAGGMGAEILTSRGSQEPFDLVRLHPGHQERGSTLLIRLEDGSGVAVAGIPGFIGSVAFENGVAIDVSYQPSGNSEKWRRYRLDNPKQRLRIEALHAMAAAAARTGDFRVHPKDANRFAERIRVGKGTDPTLGIHATYAYADAGRGDQSRQIAQIMRDDIGVQIYDIALMAGALRNVPVSKFADNDIYPFCPMMMRGWACLKTMNGRVPGPVRKAAQFLKPALWSTFDEEGMDILFEAVRKGKLR